MYTFGTAAIYCTMARRLVHKRSRNIVKRSAPCLEGQERAPVQRANIEARYLWPSVLQLFLWEDHPQSSPKPIGSSVLVKVKNAVFIFSAAHVLANFKDKMIWIGAANNVAPLQGEHRLSLTGRPEMGDHQNDPIDAAVDLLPVDSSCHLSAHALDVSAIDTGNSNAQEARYLLLGYPANRTETDRRKKAILSERKPLVFQEVPAEDYAKIGYERQTYLLLRYRNELKSVRGKHRARNLQGSSGGGIWRFDPHSNSTPNLVAIFTELKPVKGGKVLVGTRVWKHLGLAASCVTLAT